MKNLMIIFFQLENVFVRLLDYGVLGIVLIIVGYFAFKMYNKINEDQKIWREEAIKSRQDLIDLTVKQNELNTTLIQIRQNDVKDHNKHFYDIRKKLENLPSDLRKELSVELLQAKCENKINTTPSRT